MSFYMQTVIFLLYCRLTEGIWRKCLTILDIIIIYVIQSKRLACPSRWYYSSPVTSASRVINTFCETPGIWISCPHPLFRFASPDVITV